MNDDFNKMLSDYQSLKSSILSHGSVNNNGGMDSVNAPEEVKWAIAQEEGFVPHYNPNRDSVVWMPKQETPMEQIPNVMKAGGSMSPEQIANIYPIFQWKNTSGFNDVLAGIIKDLHAGNITTQRAEELVMQLTKESYKEARKATGFSESKLKPQDKVSTKEMRDALINVHGADYASESNYLKQMKEEVE
ncbi:hypothetical protein ACU41F_003137 [Klebsiella aerogenes]